MLCTLNLISTFLSINRGIIPINSKTSICPFFRLKYIAHGNPLPLRHLCISCVI